MTSPQADLSSPTADLPPTGAAARAQYYEAATSWADDTHASLRQSRKTAWIIAGVAVGVAGLQAIAMAFLLPLKQAVPYTIIVDRDTGYVQTARGIDLGPLSENEAITQSFLVQYVLARESFEGADYQANFRKTLLWSKDAAEIEYRRDWDANNPVGIRSRVRPTTRIKVIVKSVTILGPKSAMVRFETEQSEGPNSGGSRQPWAATLSYSYSNRPIAEQDRYLNPLGFQIETYRRDAETTQPISVAPPPPPALIAPAVSMPATGTPAQQNPTTGAAAGNVPTPQNGVAPTPVPTASPQPTSPSKTGNPNGEEFPAQ
jgi:type IV secretion system protein VirB8